MEPIRSNNLMYLGNEIQTKWEDLGYDNPNTSNIDDEFKTRPERRAKPPALAVNPHQLNRRWRLYLFKQWCHHWWDFWWERFKLHRMIKISFHSDRLYWRYYKFPLIILQTAAKKTELAGLCRNISLLTQFLRSQRGTTSFSSLSLSLFALTSKYWGASPLDAPAAHFCLLEAKHMLMNYHIIRKCICEWYTSGGWWPPGHLSPPRRTARRRSLLWNAAGRPCGWNELTSKVSINHAAMHPRTGSALPPLSTSPSRSPTSPFLCSSAVCPVKVHLDLEPLCVTSSTLSFVFWAMYSKKNVYIFYHFPIWFQLAH